MLLGLANVDAYMDKPQPKVAVTMPSVAHVSIYYGSKMNSEVISEDLIL